MLLDERTQNARGELDFSITFSILLYIDMMQLRYLILQKQNMLSFILFLIALRNAQFELLS